MPVTANRGASTWTPQLIGKAEEFFNSGAVEDLMIRNYLYYHKLKSMGRVKVGTWGAYQALSVNQLNQGGVTWFDHLDTLAAPVQDGPQAAQWYRAQCAKGLSYSATQEADNKNGNVDLLAFAVDSMVQDFLADYNRTLVVGAGSSSKQPDGLETGIYADDHKSGVLPEAAKTWEMRQAANSYAGIQRAAFTTATATGTGWENVSVSVSEAYNSGYTNGTDNVFKWTAYGIPSKMVKTLDNTIASCSDGGGSAPDLGLWTRKPFIDYKSMYPGTVQYALTSGAAGEFNLAAETIKHGSMTIGWSDEFLHSGTRGDASTNGELLYLLSTDAVCILTEEGWNFASRPWLAAQDQLASSMFLVWRGFHMVTNPRKCGVIFDYNAA